MGKLTSIYVFGHIWTLILLFSVILILMTTILILVKSALMCLAIQVKSLTIVTILRPKTQQINEHLFSVLRLTTTGAARSLL